MSGFDFVRGTETLFVIRLTDFPLNDHFETDRVLIMTRVKILTHSALSQAFDRMRLRNCYQVFARVACYGDNDRRYQGVQAN